MQLLVLASSVLADKARKVFNVSCVCCFDAEVDKRTRRVRPHQFAVWSTDSFEWSAV